MIEERSDELDLECVLSKIKLSNLKIMVAAVYSSQSNETLGILQKYQDCIVHHAF